MNVDRAAWLEERRTYIGGSDIAAICGLSPYRTPLDVYLEKTGQLPKKEEFTSEKTYWGTVLEPVIAEEYAKRTGNTIEINDGPIRHPKYPFLAANIDRWVNNKSFVFEAKTTSLKCEYEWGAQGTDAIPTIYLFQVTWYGGICDVEKVDIGVLIGGQEFRLYTYYRNKDFEEKLIKIGCNFWHRHVLPKIPPPPLNTKDISLLHPVSKDMPIVANDNMKEIAEELKVLKIQEKTITKKIETLSFEVQKYMENHNVLLDDMGNALITWNNTTKGNRMFLIK